EAGHAKLVATHLGTEHTEVYLGPRDALDLIQRLPSVYSEPFADSSQIPTFLLSRITREHVTVALSGDAGDELFGGYNRYLLHSQLWRKVKHLPLVARRAAASVLRAVSPSAWYAKLGVASTLLSAQRRVPGRGDKAHKRADVLGMPQSQALYRQLVSQWTDPAAVVV